MNRLLAVALAFFRWPWHQYRSNGQFLCGNCRQLASAETFHVLQINERATIICHLCWRAFHGKATK
jgi:hypothetical protein